jgi:hypothetical protein
MGGRLRSNSCKAIQRLESEKAVLQAKLKEALAAQPPRQTRANWPWPRKFATWRRRNSTASPSIMKNAT